MNETPRLLILGAHPDDAEFHGGGLATIYRQLDRPVKLISVTDGAAGHHQRPPDELIVLQRIAGSVFVPPDTDFLVIELKLIPRDPVPENDAVTFAGHFADDVQLVLRTVRSNRDLD